MLSFRLTILCEDRLTERFLRRLCERYHHQVQEVVVSPSGNGDASAWVKKQYAEQVKKRRSKNYQKQLGLLVCVDGDEVGCSARQQEMNQALQAANIERRTPEEPIAVLVPTWSIETWLAALCGKSDIVEDHSYKDEAAYRSQARDLFGDGAKDSATCRSAAEAWKATTALLPSLAEAYAEAKRVRM